MTQQPLIVGLRTLFLQGATITGLLRYLLTHHTGKLTAATVREYIQAAFGVVFHDPIRLDIDNPANAEAYAALNAFLIPEIAALSSVWRDDAGEPENAGKWLDDVNENHRAGSPTPSWLRQGGFANLTAEEQERLQQMEAGSRLMWERVRVLAHLAERLQQQVPELGAELSGANQVSGKA